MVMHVSISRACIHLMLKQLSNVIWGKCSALHTAGHSCQLCTTRVPLIVRVHYCDKVESTN